MKSLECLFEPRSVALIGASERPNSLGAILNRNLREGGFEGPIHLVNPKRAEIGGERAFPSVRDVPGGDIDTAVIVTPAPTVPDIIDECGQRGVRSAIIISAGFREAGPQGRARERDLVRRARAHGIRFLGPNCLGVIRPPDKFNATFAASSPPAGRTAVVSQSGALCTAILDWARSRDIGFSAMISTGIGADVEFGEILDYLTRDPHTDSIMLYVEGIHDARRFMSALRAAARALPIVVMKAGRHSEGSKAAASHTGALVGSDDAFDAALRRAGVLRVSDFADFFATASTLSTGVRTKGRRLAIVTNAGGPGVMAADHVVDRGLELASLSDSTIGALDEALPESWSRGNPIDVLGDAGPDRYAAAVERCMADPLVDAILVILTPQALTAPTDVARRLVELTKGKKKPVIACWMGGELVAEGRSLFHANGIPALSTPEAGVDAFAAVARYASNQAQLLQAPAPAAPRSPADLEGARSILDTISAEGKEWLNPVESKAVLAACSVPVLRSLPAHTAMEAVLIAEELGFPVAMKILSPDIVHKTDVGGVRLTLRNAAGVRSAYEEMMTQVTGARPDAKIDGVLIEPMSIDRRGREFMIGVVRDEVFGPVITFGLGGTLVEVIKDRAVALPPLNSFLVEDLVGRTRAKAALGALRGLAPVDMEQLESVLLGVSEMICELPRILEMDLNPVIAGPDSALVVDARIRIGRMPPDLRPYGHMAIHPYPSALVRTVLLPDGTSAVIRPIRPEDAQIEQEFVNGLSDRSRYLRFMYALKEITPLMLAKFTQIDYDREMALIAVKGPPGRETQMGVARYTTEPDGTTCEFAIAIADAWQGRGLSRQLMSAIIEAARGAGLQRIAGTTLRENTRMLDLSRSLGFEVEPDPNDASLCLMTRNLHAG